MIIKTFISNIFQVLIMLSWQVSIHFAFIQLNGKEGFLKWIIIANEVPAHSDNRVVGLSRKEANEFWATENRFNHLFYRLGNIFIVFVWCILSVQYFMVSFDVDFRLFILVQAFHISYILPFCYFFFHSIYTLSIFQLSLSKFLAKKFRYLTRQLARMNVSSKPINNRKLASLIYKHSIVQIELLDVNDFFKVFAFLPQRLMIYHSKLGFLISPNAELHWLQPDPRDVL